jgi:hypothetical protein
MSKLRHGFNGRFPKGKSWQLSQAASSLNVLEVFFPSEAAFYSQLVTVL